MNSKSIILLAAIAIFSSQLAAQSSVTIKEASFEKTEEESRLSKVYTLDEREGVAEIRNNMDQVVYTVSSSSKACNLYQALPDGYVYVLHDAIFFRESILLEIRGIGKIDQPESLYAMRLSLDGEVDRTYGRNGILNISNHIQTINEDGFVYMVCPLMFTDNEYVYLDKGNALSRFDTNFNLDVTFGILGETELEYYYGSVSKEIWFDEDIILYLVDDPAVEQIRYNVLYGKGQRPQDISTND